MTTEINLCGAQKIMDFTHLSPLTNEDLRIYLERVRMIAQLGDEAAIIELDKLVGDLAIKLVPQKIQERSILGAARIPHDEGGKSSALLPDVPSPYKGRLQHLWEGYYSPYHSHSRIAVMRLSVEAIRGEVWLGKLHWPDSSNTITNVRGKLVYEVVDLVEQSRWHCLPGAQHPQIPGLIFIETAFLQGDQTSLDGIYYAHLGPDGKLHGGWFYNKQPMEPAGTFCLSRNHGDHELISCDYPQS
jgi:hypothetical protein